MKKVAIVIGHNPRGKGAYSPHLEQSEYEYYRDICDLINKLDDSIDIYSREPNGSYLTEMKPVVAELNKHDYKFILELHFNASDKTSAHGCECLVYHKSKVGELIGKRITDKLADDYSSKIRQRDGLIRVESYKEQGGYGICMTKAPYVLVEPFFNLNAEAKKFRDKEKFARFIVNFIRKEMM